jgi:glucose/arabinose dehydrogenase
MFIKILSFLAVAFLPFSLFSQTPTLTDNSLRIRAITETPFAPVKIAHNQQDSMLYVLTQSDGIYQIDAESGSSTRVQSAGDLGLEDIQGLDIATDGTFYIVGNDKNEQNATNTVQIRRGVITDGNWEWTTVAEAAPYPLSNTDFDHIMNEIVVGPNDKFLYINSGSRTDHGEIQDVDGQYPDLRETPLTAKIIRVPADSTDLYLENDLQYLKDNGYIFAEGTRNSFGLAFDGNGKLFSADNAGERDDPGEFNWLQEGNHYGFPWRIGGNNTPMQFEGYDPSEDPLLSTDSRSAIFYNDPNYPAPPEGVSFVEPILNYGPDAVNYKDAETGEVFSASEQDTAISSFTGHRSSLGLIFDTDSVLTDSYKGDGFVLAFTGGNDGSFLLQHMDDAGEDLLHLELTKDGDTYTMQSTIIAHSFLNPIDSEIVKDKIYVMEFRNDWLNNSSSPWSNVRDTQIWEIDFSPMATGIEEPVSQTPSQFSLSQNYPNPFNPTTQITYALNRPGQVTLEVYNTLGKKVSTLVNMQQSSGQHSVTFNAQNLPSGLYFYRLSLAGDQSSVQTRKMMLLK